jgi:hypothetical protein
LRAAKLDQKLTPEHVEKLRMSNLGKHRSPETTELMRQEKLGVPRKPFTDEHKRNISLGKKGKPHKKHVGETSDSEVEPYSALRLQTLALLLPWKSAI